MQTQKSPSWQLLDRWRSMWYPYNNKEKDIKEDVTWFLMAHDIIFDKSIAWRFLATPATCQIIGQRPDSNAITTYANELSALLK